MAKTAEGKITSVTNHKNTIIIKQVLKMIELNIPGGEPLYIEHLVLDYNGTIAFDGKLLSGLKGPLGRIAEFIKVHVITADTFGHVQEELKGMNLNVNIIESGNQDLAKKNYIEKLGASCCVCIGNGRNDRLMLQDAGIGIALIQQEGASTQAVMASDIICTDAASAIELLLNKNRLTATLRI